MRFEYTRFEQTNRSFSECKKIFEKRLEDAADVYNKFSSDFLDRECPVCGSEQSREIDKFHHSYGIECCERCCSVFVNPCPPLEALSYYYNNCSCNQMLEDLYTKRAQAENNQIISGRVLEVVEMVKEVVKDSISPVNILEVGCNSGTFLTELKHGLKWAGIADYCKLVGLDIDEIAIGKCTDPDLELHACPVEEFVGDGSIKFDIVLHFELIEHLVDPFRFMKSMWKLMRPNGIQYFHTPNALGYDNMALGWNANRPLAHGVFPPMHLNAFTTQNIVHFALRSGFRVVNIETPGTLDVDMVQMMSDELPRDSVFEAISAFDTEQLACVQELLKKLRSSSHMSVMLRRCDG